MVETFVVETIPRFSHLKHELKTWIAKNAQLRLLSKGEILFTQGDGDAKFWILVSGSLRVFRTLESGRELTMNIFFPGDAVGEVAVIDGAEYPSSAIAAEDAQVLSLSKSDYFKLLEYPQAVASIIRDLTLRMRTLSSRVEDLGFGECELRLARVIKTLDKRIGQLSDNKDLIELNFTRQELADLIGSRTETTIRVISKWTKAGHVMPSTSGIKVHKVFIDELLNEK